MPILTSGSNVTLTVSAGQILTVQSDQAIFDFENPVGTRLGEYGADTVFGPFTSSGSVKLSSVQGPVYYELASKPVGQSVPFDPSNVVIGGGAIDKAPVSALSFRLPRWAQKLATDPANAVVMFIGDSTSDEAGSAQYMYQALRGQHCAVGGALYGMTADMSHVVSAGNNGISLAAWLADSTKLANVVAKNPHLIVASFLINDVRLGQCDLPTAKSRLTTLVNTLRASVPNADILLRMPNAMLTTDVSNLHYVQDSVGNVNPAGAAQSYSTLMRQAYLSMIGQWATVDVIDIQAEVFGTVARATHSLMADQLHPSPYGATVGATTYGGGYVAIADAIARRIGFNWNAFNLDSGGQYTTVKEGLTVAASGTWGMDVSSLLKTNALSAAQFPLTTSDVLFIDGFSDPISLGTANIYRPFGGSNIRITGIGDMTAALGKNVSIGCMHPGPTTGDRQIVSVTIASIAAGATAETLVSVTGARTGDLQDSTNIVCTPPAAFNTAGLRLLGCYPSANDQAKLIVNNPTAGALGLAATNFTFWVVR